MLVLWILLVSSIMMSSFLPVDAAGEAERCVIQMSVCLTRKKDLEAYRAYKAEALESGKKSKSRHSFCAEKAKPCFDESTD